MLCALDGEALHKEVLPAALERGQVNEGVRSRVLCCKLLALLIPYLVRQPGSRGQAAMTTDHCFRWRAARLALGCQP